jgi:predicted ArsR family transcriptional regulator
VSEPKQHPKERAKKNRVKILELVEEEGIITRPMVADKLDMKDTTAWDNIEWLVDNNYLEEIKSVPTGKKGRPKTQFRRVKKSISLI